MSQTNKTGNYQGPEEIKNKATGMFGSYDSVSVGGYTAADEFSCGRCGFKCKIKDIKTVMDHSMSCRKDK